MSNKYFDQVLGTQTDSTSIQEKKLAKNILDAYIKEQPKEEIQENQRVGVILKMKTYLDSKTKERLGTGEFLNMLIEIYNINKSKFARHIGIENSNLHALLKGRRKFNSRLATIIGEIFNISPELWLFIEAKNELQNFSIIRKTKPKKVNILEISHDR